MADYLSVFLCGLKELSDCGFLLAYDSSRIVPFRTRILGFDFCCDQRQN